MRRLSSLAFASLLIFAIATGAFGAAQKTSPSGGLAAPGAADGAGDLEALSPASGGGTRPLLEWRPLAGADHYSVTLYAPDGDAYWAWFGNGTSVHVGGDPQLREEAPGPRVIDGMAWMVIAYDESGIPLGSGGINLISP